MAKRPRKRKAKPKAGRLVALFLEDKRKRTESVKYFVKYRDRNTGRYSKFVPKKSLNPEVWISSTRLSEDRTQRETFQKRKLILKARKAKNPITAKRLAAVVEQNLLKFKAAKDKIQTIDGQVILLYPERQAAKAAGLQPLKEQKKGKKQRKKKGKKRVKSSKKVQKRAS